MNEWLYFLPSAHVARIFLFDEDLRRPNKKKILTYYKYAMGCTTNMCKNHRKKVAQYKKYNYKNLMLYYRYRNASSKAVFSLT